MTYNEAKKLYEEKDYINALPALKEFFEYYKNNSSVLYYIADCYLHLEKYDEALEYVLPFIDDKVITHSRMAHILCEIIKAKFIIVDIEEQCLLMERLLELWKKSSCRVAQYLATYGNLCRKSGLSENFLQELSKDVNDTILTDQYIINTQAWCMYDVYIKSYEFDASGFDLFYEKAARIVELTEQLEDAKAKFNPYVITIIKVIKALKKRSYVSYRKVLNWIEKLNPDMLPSDDEFPFTTDEGKEREICSSKEFYYQQITKAYEKLENYEECLFVCNKALNENIKWHNRNHLWITARKYYCECMVAEGKDKAIESYKKLVEKYKFWYMYHKLGLIYKSQNNVKSAMVYMSKALDNNEYPKKLVNVMFDLASHLHNENKIVDCKILTQACAYYRNKEDWNISEELQYLVKYYDINSQNKPNINAIRNVAKKILSELGDKNTENDCDGKIFNIHASGNSGIIKNTRDDKIFFYVSQVVGGKSVNIGDVVTYEMGENKQGPMAINIIKRSI